MNINEFATRVCLEEHGKKQVNVAQVKEVLKVTNQLVDGKLYQAIRAK